MEPGQVELSSLMGWLRTFSLQSQVSHTFGLQYNHIFGSKSSVQLQQKSALAEHCGNRVG